MTKCNDPTILLADNIELRKINRKLRLEIMSLLGQNHSDQRSIVAWKLRYKKLVQQEGKNVQSVIDKNQRIKKLKRRCKKLIRVSDKYYRASLKLIGRLVDYKARVDKLETHIRIHKR